MSIVLGQVAKLLVFIAIGYILGHFNIVDKNHSKILSVLLVYLISPCNNIKSLANGFTIEYFKNYYPMIIASGVLLILTAFVAIFASRFLSKDRYERCVYHYSLVIPNYGYMGYALAEGIFGESGLLNMVVFTLLMSVYICSIGYVMLTNEKFSFKLFLKPVFASLVIGIFLGLTKIPVPAFAMDVLNTASACLSPLAMLLTGIVISEFNLKDLVTEKKTYIVSALRLIIIPIIILFIMKPLFSTEIITTAVLFFALPCGLNTIVYAKSANENYVLGAKLAVVSNVLSLITLPLILSLI